MPSGVRVEGLNKTIKALQSLGVEVADMKEAMSAISTEGARLVADMAPKVTGALAATVRGNKAKNKAVVMAGRARVKYAGAINYGWPARNIEPSFFMQRADAALAPRAVAMLEEGLDTAMRKAGLQ